MKTDSVLAFLLLTQIYFANCQLGYRRESLQGNRRHSSGSSGPSSVLPEFISRTLGLAASEDNEKPALKRRSSLTASHTTPVRTIVPANRRASERPYTTRVNQGLGSGSHDAAPTRRRSNLHGASAGGLSNKRTVLARETTEEGKPVKRKTASPSVAVTPPKSLEGWVSHPTEPSVAVTTKIPPVADKAGQCGSTFSYGIQCAVRMDQCSQHSHCPGDTLCCMVEECGYMCVKPKTKSDGNKKKRGSVDSIMRRQSEQAEESSEVSTTAMGLKLDDITSHVEGS